MKISIFDFSNTHVFHRKALLGAISHLNEKTNLPCRIQVVVGVRNIIKCIPSYLRSKSKFVLIFTGFGRLFTNYGFVGRMIFFLIVRLFSQKKVLAFVVENSNDFGYLSSVSNINVYQTSGSGLDSSGFQLQKNKTQPKSDMLTFGYLSRFDRSKGSDEILKIARELPESCQFYLAGWDVTGDKFSSQFSAISLKKSNVHFLGKLNSRQEVSDFFNSIDVFLCPSLREGGCISIQESVWHSVPFITTNVPGCLKLAKIFDCPAYEINNFAKDVLENIQLQKEPNVDDWPAKLAPFLEDNVRAEFIEIFEEILSTRKL